MELRDKAKEILAKLIRNKFDATPLSEVQALKDLIAVAKDSGLAELASEMQSDLDFELTKAA